MEENKSEYEATRNSYRKAPKNSTENVIDKAVEKSRTKLQEITSMQENGDYTTAPDTGSAVTDTTYSMVKGDHRFHCAAGAQVYPQSKFRNTGNAAQQSGLETTRAHTASECGVSPKQAGHGTLPMQSNTRAVGRICPDNGRKKKLSPPKPRRATFAA